jgi:acyl carrier protein phosphodiesterase
VDPHAGIRLSGAIVDVFYDHVLARRWSEHHPLSLSAYTQDVYRTLRGNLQPDAGRGASAGRRHESRRLAARVREQRWAALCPLR